MVVGVISWLTCRRSVSPTRCAPMPSNVPGRAQSPDGLFVRVMTSKPVQPLRGVMKFCWPGVVGSASPSMAYAGAAGAAAARRAIRAGCGSWSLRRVGAYPDPATRAGRVVGSVSVAGVGPPFERGGT